MIPGKRGARRRRRASSLSRGSCLTAPATQPLATSSPSVRGRAGTLALRRCIAELGHAALVARLQAPVLEGEAPDVEGAADPGFGGLRQVARLADAVDLVERDALVHRVRARPRRARDLELGAAAREQRGGHRERDPSSHALASRSRRVASASTFSVTGSRRASPGWRSLPKRRSAWSRGMGGLYPATADS